MLQWLPLTVVTEHFMLAWSQDRNNSRTAWHINRKKFPPGKKSTRTSKQWNLCQEKSMMLVNVYTDKALRESPCREELVLCEIRLQHISFIIPWSHFLIENFTAVITILHIRTDPWMNTVSLFAYTSNCCQTHHLLQLRSSGGSVPNMFWSAQLL